jgi:hypothetical protein
VFDLTRVRNLKKTSFFVFCRFFDFLRFRRADVVRTSRSRRAKCRANAISSFRRCFISHNQCDRDTQMPFGVSLKECFSNFLRDFFFFANLVGRSNSWLNTVAHMIRLRRGRGRDIRKRAVVTDCCGVLIIDLYRHTHNSLLWLLLR